MYAGGTDDVESHNGYNFARNCTLVCFLFPESHFLASVYFARAANLRLFSHFCRKKKIKLSLVPL